MKGQEKKGRKRKEKEKKGNGSLKKVYRDLDHVEKCGFLYGVQHVSNNTVEVFLDIANF